MYGATLNNQIESFLALHDLCARSDLDKFNTACELTLAYNNNENSATVTIDLKAHMRSMWTNEKLEFFNDIMAAFNNVSVQPEHIQEFLNKYPDLKATANTQAHLCEVSRL
ncbi:hypothetical protein [Pseudomonas entomophila]|uniref:hypothetical protein n=1 Tax=Pseudomonas entomophila TaxID=312306 RepID=UPI001F0077C3|nr:hypothetical protein [Pseudomonas entomophila]MCG8291472.1 hypothetical protein [Pseudomonas entomophila]